ncbi:MAG: c-type cytochrome [Alysiella sp.]|uniref:c-type cytochrome n=1 Tax=Alysiella sp. TaxID=1872483 RepID=UPI0026DD66D9|nr:c-type cytochrome [Alysiella sp.]MDO4434467.1 c-type cytochrome [Alysiella sp.]
MNFKNRTQGSVLTTLLGGIIITVAALYLLVKLAGSGFYSDVADSTKDATQTRIMPSGILVMGDGTEPGQRTGEQVFNKICIQCHAADSSIAYAPKITHNDQWSARIAQGFNTLVKHAIEGFTGSQGGVMPAKGGAVDLTDDEVARAVAYMANQSGGNFTEPAAKGGSDSKTASDTATTSDAANSGSQAASGRGQEIFEQSCKACHGVDSPFPGAPKITKNEDWAPRIKQGETILFKHAIEGFTGKAGMMPAKGGNASLSDDDVKAAVQYMVKQSGG